jgi:RHS repeat-associated protein
MVVDLAYDAGMRETQRQHGNGLFTRRVYGRDDNLVTGIVNETSLNAANRPDASFAYTYDDNKNVISETTGTTSSPMEHYSWTTSGGATAGYDAEDRLTYWTRSSSGSGSIHTQAWPINHGSTGLSLVGDWTTVNVNGVTQSRTHNAVHELLTVNSTGLTHDAKGNLTRDAGDTLDRFQWDFDNRMKAADVDQDGTNDLTFTYDALGRRVSKNDTAGSVHTVYVCMGIDMGQVACEYLANADPATTAPQQTYVYGGYVDEPLIKVDSASTKLYYHANRQYSVTALTDSSGTVVERYAYSPYGVTTILAPNGSTPRATSSVGNSYMYTGRRLDKEFASSSEDAIYYYRARYYLPSLGRFGSRDLLRYVDGMSVYAGYFAMQHGLDPSGLDDDDDEHWKKRLEAAGVDVQEAINEAKNMGITDPERIKQYVEQYNTSRGRGGRFKCGRYRGKSLAQLIGGGIKKAWNRLFGSGGGTKGAAPAPTPVGRRGNPMHVPNVNSGQKLNGREYSGHAIDQMQGRGIPPSVVEDTIRTGTKSPDPIPGRIRYYDAVNDLTVVTESNGTVVTVMHGER